MMNSNNYSELYTWFEKSGIISNIRTHLRQNLVSALKHETPFQEGKGDMRSAKQYVYDLLVAEYLLTYNYAYTLSVLTSEAPLLINLNRRVEPSTFNPGKTSKNKLPNDHVYHTLETLGINPDRSSGKVILAEYSDSQTPLILCIIRCLISQLKNTTAERDVGKTCMQNQYTQTDCLKSLTTQEHDIAKAREKLYQQKSIFDTQLKNKELKLKEQALAIEQQLSLLNEKLQHAQNLMQIVDAKENNLARKKIEDEQVMAGKKMELCMKEKLLFQEAERLQKERDSYQKLEGDMKKLQNEVTRLRNQLLTKSNDLHIIKQDAWVQTDIYNGTNTLEDIRILNEEKQELFSLIKEQQSRIEELTLRAITLSRQLEEAQLLKSCKTDSLSNNMTRHVNINNIVSESSSTEDILQDAKMRLKRLEQESLRADQYFYNCIATSP